MHSPEFLPAPNEPASLKNEIHVWRYSIDDQKDPSQWQNLLSDAESTRAAKFALPKLNLRFIARRAVRRIVLGRYLNCCPTILSFETIANGKPCLSDEFKLLDNTTLDFNDSHSGPLYLLAISNNPSGVDVENIREVPKLESMFGRTFSQPELETIRNMPTQLQTRSFFQHWTSKEAVLKVSGEGLAGSLSSVNVNLNREKLDNEFHSIVRRNEIEYHVQRFSPAEGFMAAVASPAIANENQLPLRLRWFDAGKLVDTNSG